MESAGNGWGEGERTGEISWLFRHFEQLRLILFIIRGLGLPQSNFCNSNSHLAH